MFEFLLHEMCPARGFTNPNLWVCIRISHGVSFDIEVLLFVADRRPVLKGDNLWRGHAAAFVRHARLAPEDILCEGRVLQVFCVFFINASSISVFVKVPAFSSTCVPNLAAKWKSHIVFSHIVACGLLCAMDFLVLKGMCVLFPKFGTDF